VLLPRQERIFRHRHAIDLIHLTLGGDLLHGLTDVLGTPRPHMALDDPSLRHLVEALLVARQSGPASRLFDEAGARALAARLAMLNGRAEPAPTRHGLPPAALARVLELLHARLAEDVSIDELAREAGLSPAHFSTLFRNSTGVPPHQHQLRLRVERAQQLLQQGLEPGEAAVAVGFYDQSHLTRHMRRLLGVTPGALAREHRVSKERPRGRRFVQAHR
jgi:AraC family transcriptional regulator